MLPFVWQGTNSLFIQRVWEVMDVQLMGVDQRQPQSEEEVRQLREWWLYHASVFLMELMEAAGVPTAPVWIRHIMTGGFMSHRMQASKQHWRAKKRQRR